MRMLVHPALAVIACLILPALAAAQPFERNVKAELVSEMASVGPGQRFLVGLRQEIREGWHTYWRNPGDSGAATSIAWSVPEGVEVGAIAWPRPERIPYFDLINYGYEDEVVLLSEVSVPDDWPAGRPLRIEADANWLVCSDICIPEEAHLSLDIPTSGGPSKANTDASTLIDAARSELPVASPWPLKAYRQDGKLALLVENDFSRGRIDNAYFFPSEPGVLDAAAEQPLSIGRKALRLDLEGGKKRADQLKGVLVLTENVDGRQLTRGFEVAATPEPGLPVREAGMAGIGLTTALAFALLGGLVLNLMPCVFPILSLKALGLVQQAHEAPLRARLHGLSYTGGVLAMFVILAGGLVGLRAAGAQVGWGFQLQSPIVVTLLAYLLFVVGLNLSGVFEVGGRFMGLGGGLAARSSYVGSFGTGALAVVVATPCTAPFMGAATSFALFQPVPETLAVFLALGLGLALPYLALSFVPAFARTLPRPGRWMGRLKQGLAFPIYASAAWLLWVLSQQVDAPALLGALMGLILVAFAAWLFGIAGSTGSGIWRHAGMGAAVISLLAAGILVPRESGQADVAATAVERDPLAQAYTPQRLETLRAQGDPVFVNLTAAWCITCEVNERVALSGERFADRFERHGITYLIGDWTNRDPAITALLEQHGRAGVPLYLVYPRGQGEAEVLPQILTERMVLDALDRAASPIPAGDGEMAKASGAT